MRPEGQAISISVAQQENKRSFRDVIVALRLQARNYCLVKRTIEPCEPVDLPVIFEIINESAQVYKGVIPADRFHEPYMPMRELRSEIAKGIRFYFYNQDGRTLGVMGIQDVKDVTLIRHAYVRRESQGQGIGRALLEHLSGLTDRPILIGTWKAADWAIRFYQNNGFALVGTEEKNQFLRTYWTIPDRQIEESVVLVNPAWRKRCSGAS